MRKSILEELYYVNVCPSTDCRVTSDETTELMSYLAAHHQCKLKYICERKLFIYTIKLFTPDFQVPS